MKKSCRHFFRIFFSSSFVCWSVFWLIWVFLICLFCSPYECDVWSILNPLRTCSTLWLLFLCCRRRRNNTWLEMDRANVTIFLVVLGIGILYPDHWRDGRRRYGDGLMCRSAVWKDAAIFAISWFCFHHMAWFGFHGVVCILVVTRRWRKMMLNRYDDLELEWQRHLVPIRCECMWRVGWPLPYLHAVWMLCLCKCGDCFVDAFLLLFQNLSKFSLYRYCVLCSFLLLCIACLRPQVGTQAS